MIQHRIFFIFEESRSFSIMGSCEESGHKVAIKRTILLKVQGVPQYWTRFVFVIFSGSRAHTEELFIAIG